MRDGKIIHEDYAGPQGASQARELASGTKSFVGAIALIAEADGLLSLDEPVAKTITEWGDDPQKSAITIRQLLTLTSGIAGGTIGEPPTYSDALMTPVTAEPGTKFQYGPAPFQIFGEVLRRKLSTTGEGVLDYMKRRLFEPIGLTVGAWRMGADGNPNLPSGARLTAAEWAKFGQLILDGGKAGEKQIIPAEPLKAALKGTSANPFYGLTFWVAGTDPEDSLEGATGTKPLAGAVPADLVMAAGLGKQRLYISPAERLVVVRQGRLNDNRFRDAEFLSALRLGNLPEGTALQAAPANQTPGNRRQPGGNWNSEERRSAMLSRIMERYDTNNDGKISPDEAPESVQANFAGLDTDGDGFLSQSELEAAPPGSFMPNRGAWQQRGGEGGQGRPQDGQPGGQRRPRQND
jgi:CubicO group peptidase (beta-lactamase class C family)